MPGQDQSADRTQSVNADVYDRRNPVDRRVSDGYWEGAERRKGDRRSGRDRRVNDRRASDHDRRKGVDSYSQVSGIDKRNEMIKRHLPLVSYVASRLAIGLPDWLDKRDLVNTGVIGLIDAVNSFDPGKGVKFETYAKTRIRGAILDELRAQDWIPRSTRAKSREIERAISNLARRLGRFPMDEEIARELDWDMAKYYKALGQVSVTTLLSLDDMVNPASTGDPIRRIDTVAGDSENPLDTIEHEELVGNVVNIIEGLSEQERLVVALYYYEELTLKEIGMVMSVTESRISQIHTAAILKIRSRLGSIYVDT